MSWGWKVSSENAQRPNCTWPGVVLSLHPLLKWPSPCPGRAESTAHIPAGCGMQVSQTAKQLLQIPHTFILPRSSEPPRRVQPDLSSSCYTHACWGTQSPELSGKSLVTHVPRKWVPFCAPEMCFSLKLREPTTDTCVSDTVWVQNQKWVSLWDVNQKHSSSHSSFPTEFLDCFLL